MVSFTHEQNSIWSHKLSHKQLNDIAHEHTIICRQLFAGHVVSSRPMKRTKHLHRMIIRFTFNNLFEAVCSLYHNIEKVPVFTCKFLFKTNSNKRNDCCFPFYH